MKNMKIASYNINGIKARLFLLREWLEKEKPDVVGIQELKSDNINLDKEMFSDLGYFFIYNGQKAYNGCALLSKFKITNTSFFFPGNENDKQSRWLSAEISGIFFCNLYLPNGNPVGTEKFEYKINWMSLLYEYSKKLISLGMPVILLGDFNVIPQEIDCSSPKKWKNDALFKEEVRSIFFKILNLGFYDALRLKTSLSNIYTQWDYQGGAWPQNDGVRIDHFLLNSLAADRLISCGLDKYMRGKDRPSDHIPIWIEIENDQPI